MNGEYAANQETMIRASLLIMSWKQLEVNVAYSQES